MADKSKDQGKDDKVSDQEAERRRDEIAKKMLRTPPKPHKGTPRRPKRPATERDK